MLHSLLIRQIARTGFRFAGIAVFLWSSFPVTSAHAQRPFPVNDPFYRSETARRVFYDGLAASGEISYRTTGAAAASDFPTGASPLGLSLRLHYQLATRVDLNAFWDAEDTGTGRTIVLSWVGLKYFWSVDNADYAFRLAVDPSSDGRVGFPQLDAAFISTKALSPVLSSDFAVGVRRVRMGFRQFSPADESASLADGPLVIAENSTPRITDTRALGMELHFMWSYNLIFDPARSNLFLALIGEGGQYQLLESDFGAPSNGEETDEEFGSTDYRGGVVWIRSGIEFNRPSYQIMPFMSYPVKQWETSMDDLARMQLGVRLMLR
jgi:hypothetical protein